MYIADGKKSTTIEEFKNFFQEHNGTTENVTDITCDMSMGFTTGIKKAFKNSKITYLMKVINEALDMKNNHMLSIVNHKKIKPQALA